MDHRPPRDEDFLVDLESGTGVICTIEERIPNPNSGEIPPRNDLISTRLCDQSSLNPLTVKVVIDSKVEGDLTEKKTGKEKRKKSSSSAKKPPKPPRPPRGFSLDAADQKLIKELAELAMMKRARIERMKALKQKKALKASSPSSMSGSVFAMIFTLIFFLMIFLQGMSCQNSGVTSQGSPQTAQTNENGLVFIQEQLNPSASDSILPDSKSSNLLEKISGSGSASRKLLSVQDRTREDKTRQISN
ncbi:hypothetical protein L2E82_49104 [Cichorium intybus]|uniref:Uncharacterized protein n=1 Tax=Cichorium intybus TaxID=13427 RepID=A0ACB8YYR6_CICIN|nr:hypothetical protein L2E82_49104 [Cichorium intybus]